MKTRNKPKQKFEPKVFPLDLSETVLPDDYPVNENYVYIVDGVFTRAIGDMTVGYWKKYGQKAEIRRCALFSHPGARLGDMVQLPKEKNK